LRTNLIDSDGITDVATSGNAAVTFGATREASLYALCWLRSAHRLLELVATTDDIDSPASNRRYNGKDDIDRDSLLYTRDDLNGFIRECVNAKELLGDGKGGLLTLSVKSILNNPRQLPKDLSHSHYTALSIKNALCDAVRDMRGDRPDVDVENPDLPLVAILRGMGDDQYDEGAASLSIYRSLHPPGSLHKRGYRSGDSMHKASMKVQ
jgi:23S rRNA G2445 N2-methylase RlmL